MKKERGKYTQNKIGIVIFQELVEIYPIEFLGLTDPTKPLPRRIRLNSKYPDRYKPNGLVLRQTTYKKIPNFNVRLFCYPEAIAGSSQISALEFPVPIAGAIVLIDAPRFFKLYAKYPDKKPPGFLRRTKWVYSQQIPAILIAVIHAKEILPIDRETFEIELGIPEIPVVWHDEGLSDEFQYDVLSKLCSQLDT